MCGSELTSTHRKAPFVGVLPRIEQASRLAITRVQMRLWSRTDSTFQNSFVQTAMAFTRLRHLLTLSSHYSSLHHGQRHLVVQSLIKINPNALPHLPREQSTPMPAPPHFANSCHAHWQMPLKTSATPRPQTENAPSTSCQHDLVLTDLSLPATSKQPESRESHSSSAPAMTGFLVPTDAHISTNHIHPTTDSDTPDPLPSTVVS